MNSFLYWPYDELTVEATASRDSVLVKVPWMEAKVPVTTANKDQLQILIDKFSRQDLSITDMPVVQAFFKDFTQYPLCYILPTPKKDENLDHPSLVDHKLLAATLSQVIVTAAEAYPSGSPLDHGDVLAILKNTSRADFEWDVESALAFARSGAGIHPESLFSVVRRFHLLEVLENDRGKETFDFVAGLEAAEFKCAASLIVRQNHYVTQKCQESLLPALQLAGKARKSVEDFIKEENGHDLILNVAMKAMVEEPERVPVSKHTIALMHLLRFTASRNFLAFAMVVDFFERSSYKETDPMALLLRKGGFDKAARQVNRHMEINDAGGHENVACGLLKEMAPCDLEYAREALRLAEVVSIVMNGLTVSAVALYSKSQN